MLQSPTSALRPNKLLKPSGGALRLAYRHKHRKLHICAASSVQSRQKSDLLNLVQASIKARIQFAKVKADLTADGDCIVRASFDIAAGEALISVPAAACLRVYAGDAAPGGCLPPGTWSALPWQARLAVKLLYEERQGKNSAFAAYLACLPAHVDAPAVWSDAELAQLQYSYVQAAAAAQQRQARELHALVSQQQCLQGFTLQQVFQALCLVRSRTFAAPYLPLAPSSALPAAAALQMAVAAAAVTAGSTLAGVVECLGLLAIGVAVGLVLRQAGSSGNSSGMSGTSEKGQQHVMAPMMDLVNHSSAVQASCQYDPWADDFKLVASQNYAASEQVLINYGELDSDALLLLYGFVEPCNHFERYRLPSLLGRAAAAGAGNSSQTPADEQQERLVEEACMLLRQSGLEGALDEVLLTQQGASAVTLRALQLLLEGGAVNSSSSSATGAAEALLVEACKSELQRLGSSQEGDERLLAAVQRQPQAVAELAELQKQLLHREAELAEKQAALMVATAQEAGDAGRSVATVAAGTQRSDSREGALLDEGSSASSSTSSNNSSPHQFAGPSDGSQQEHTAAAAAAAVQAAAVEQLKGEVGILHKHRQQLSSEVADLEALTAGVKLLAVQFRVEKRRFLQAYTSKA